MSIFSNFFGGGSKKRDTTYRGNTPVTSASKVLGGQQYYDEIMKRMQGRGVGFGEGYANKYANPTIKRMRSQYTNYTVPEMQDYLSATGRSRGSGGFQQMAQAAQEQGLAENDIFSQLQQRNESQKRNEINDALNSMYNWTGREADLINIASNFDLGLHNQQLAREDARRALKGSENQKLLAMGTQALGQVAPMMAPMMASRSATTPVGTSGLSTADRYHRMMTNPKSKIASRYGISGGRVK